MLGVSLSYIFSMNLAFTIDLVFTSKINLSAILNVWRLFSFTNRYFMYIFYHLFRKKKKKLIMKHRHVTIVQNELQQWNTIRHKVVRTPRNLPLMKSLSRQRHMHSNRVIVPFTELNPSDLILWYSPPDMIIIEFEILLVNLCLLAW